MVWIPRALHESKKNYLEINLCSIVLLLWLFVITGFHLSWGDQKRLSKMSFCAISKHSI